ncbi:MAG: S41 family peptidase [Sarcina sp.]
MKEFKGKNNKGYVKSWKVVLLTVGCSTVALALGNRLTAKGLLPMTINADLNKSFANVKNIDAYRDLFAIRDQIYKYYDGTIDEKKLVEGAIKGMTMGLGDPYTYYMNPDEFSSFMEQNSGEYMGVGIQVGQKDGHLFVSEPVEGGPANKVGVLAGDVIKAINGVPIMAKDMDKAVNMLKGKEKADIKLTLDRESRGQFDVVVTRDVVKTINVKGEMLKDDIGYIKIRAFEENVAKDFNTMLEQFKAQNMKGLILDLRGNPGGYMSECVGLVSNFINKGETIVSTVDKYGEKEKNLSIGGIGQGLPLVVLIDGDSASASEVVSGAIRDYGVGTLIGETSFGKGIVQIPVEQGNGSALKVTISKYYTPKGENIHQKGIKPDIEVAYPDELKQKPYNRAEDPQFNKAVEVIKGKMN